jgi:fermentation-respiration switch protein FrsA (DUF1100 family)
MPSQDLHPATPRRRNWIRRLLLPVLFLVLGWAVIVLALQRRILFPRHVVMPAPEVADAFDDLEKLWVDTDRGRVEAWLLPTGGEGPRGVLIFAHGNGELIEYWPHALEPYRRMGLSILLPEYRGYGRSAGSPTEAALKEDFVRFHDLVASRDDVDRDRIVFHGRSLGAGAVCALATDRKPAALILESAFTSVSSMAWRMGVPPFLVLDRFDNRAALGGLDVPVLIMHGSEDHIVPVAHARKLHAAAVRSRLHIYENAGHNDGLADRPEYWADIEAFLIHSGVIVGEDGR